MVAVVEVDGHQFLVGSGPTTVTLLAQLTSDEPFSNLLKETMAAPSKQPVKRQAAKPTVARIRKQA
jgi:flagellar biogenesis protein FliO